MAEQEVAKSLGRQLHLMADENDRLWDANRALQAELAAEKERANRLEGLLSQALHGKARGIR